MKNNVLKIDESTLRQIITESVKKVLNESTDSFDGPFYRNGSGEYTTTPPRKRDLIYLNKNTEVPLKYSNYASPSALKSYIEDFEKYLQLANSESPRMSDKYYQKALSVKKEIFDLIEQLDENWNEIMDRAEFSH